MIVLLLLYIILTYENEQQVFLRTTFRGYQYLPQRKNDVEDSNKRLR